MTVFVTKPKLKECKGSKNIIRIMGDCKIIYVFGKVIGMGREEKAEDGRLNAIRQCLITRFR